MQTIKDSFHCGSYLLTGSCSGFVLAGYVKTAEVLLHLASTSLEIRRESWNRGGKRVLGVIGVWAGSWATHVKAKLVIF